MPTYLDGTLLCISLGIPLGYSSLGLLEAFFLARISSWPRGIHQTFAAVGPGQPASLLKDV
eukprot:1161819-Pelagomonas_calceolata.AAC.7